MAFILAVDYDGTLFEGSWPERGNLKEDVADKVKEFQAHGAEIALWTCREGVALKEAAERCYDNGLEFDAYNDNTPSQKEYMAKKAEQGEIFATRKIFADFYVDDRAYNIEYFLHINVEETCSLDKYTNRS